MSDRRRHRRALLRDLDALHAMAVALVVLMATGGLAWLGYLWHVARVARRAPVDAGAGIVLVFGKHCAGGVPDADFLARIERARTLADAGATRLLLLGGGEHPTEAEVAARELRQRGLPAAVQLVLEDASRDTLENLRHALGLLGEGAAPVALLSNRYHLARCLLLADCVGLAAVPCAAEARFGFRPALLGEAALTMWIDIGRRWAGLIRSERMLSKLGA